MAHDLLAKRLAYILIKLNNGERFTLEELALDYCWKTQRNIPDYSIFNIRK